MNSNRFVLLRGSLSVVVTLCAAVVSAVEVTTPVPAPVVVTAPAPASTLVVTQAEQTIVVKVPAAPVVVTAPAAAPLPAASKKIALFIKNQTKTAGMDDAVDGIRERLAAAIAGTGDALTVIDASQVADTFRRYKITTAEERAGLVDGVFSGGSVTRIAQMLGCDYVVAASVVGASSIQRNVNGSLATVFTVRMTTKVMDGTGASVAGAPWKGSQPVLNSADDPMSYYDELFDRWAEDTSAMLANKAATWRAAPAAAAAVPFTVSTTVDASIAELESATKGTDGQVLLDLRKVVGGVSVELDGAVLGTSPGQFLASPGLHQLKVSRPWMTPYQATVNIQPGAVFHVALELSGEGIAKYQTMEKFRGQLAVDYAEAALRRNVKVNMDTKGWRDVSAGNPPPRIILQNDR